MPQVDLSSSSVVLSRNGWRSVSSVSDNTEILGVDRHGKIDPRPIRVHHSESEAPCYYLGTRGAFGLFSPKTNILDSSGHARSLDTLLKGDPTAVLFETVVPNEPFECIEQAALAVWGELSRVSLVSSDDELLLRCSSENGKCGIELDCAELSIWRGATYVKLKKSKFTRDVSSRGHKLIEDILDLVFSSKELVLDVCRSGYMIALWRAHMCQQADVAYALKYDSIQHTSNIKIVMTDRSPNLEKVSTAFISGATRISRIEWSDASWLPVSSGFLLSPSYQQVHK